MARSGIGENIAKYRKSAGITQEELGKAVGVSTQAVSRWECGGTPDVELLPAIADRLHVSVDALFGREDTEGLDLHRLLGNVIAQTPEAHRMEVICDYVWTMLRADAQCSEIHAIHDILAGIQRMDRSGLPAPDKTAWQVVMDTDRGIGICGIVRDMPFALVLPEPEQGYASMLKRKEEYLRLFRLLSKPRYLDMLLELYTHKPDEHVTDRLAAAKLGISLEEARAILDDLYRHCMVRRMEVADETGPMGIYGLDRNEPLPVFLLFCGLMMASAGESNLMVSLRNKPVLNAEPGAGSLAPNWNTRQTSQDESERGVWMV